MNVTNSTVFAINLACSNLRELIESVATDRAKDTAVGLQEAREVLAAFTAAVFEQDGQFNESEESLLRVLIPSLALTTDRLSLSDHARNWQSISKQVPLFFHKAVSVDRENGSQYAAAMLREIQLFGNNIAACDGRFASGEHAVVRDFISFLEMHLAPPADANPAVSTYDASNLQVENPQPTADASTERC